MNDEQILQMLLKLKAQGATPEQMASWLVGNNVTGSRATEFIAQALGSGGTGPMLPAKVGAAGKAKDWFKAHTGPGNSLLGDFNMPRIGETAQRIGQTSLYNGGPSINNLATAGVGLTQGINAVSNLSGLNAAGTDVNDMISDIKSSAYTNPMYSSYLNADQKKLFRRLKNGSYASETGSNALGEGLGASLKSLPKAALTALPMILMGNVPGAVLQAGGTLLNSGIQGATTSKNRRTAELQSLYDTLSQAENEYNTMRRPANLRGAGLQNRYLNKLY